MFRTICNGARILDNYKDRMVYDFDYTIHELVLHVCQCISYLANAFFPNGWDSTLVVFSVYFLGIIFGIIFAKIFRKFLFAGEAEPFVMELPSYHLPTLKATWMHMYERAKLYIIKARYFHYGCFHLDLVHHCISNGCRILQRLWCSERTSCSRYEVKMQLHYLNSVVLQMTKKIAVDKIVEDMKSYCTRCYWCC